FALARSRRISISGSGFNNPDKCLIVVRLHLTLLLVLQDGQLQGVFAEVKYLHRADGRLTRSCVDSIGVNNTPYEALEKHRMRSRTAGVLRGCQFQAEWLDRTGNASMCLKAQAEERSTASSLADTGGSVGGLLALGGPFLASFLGWQLTFAVYGVLSSCFCMAWLGIASSLPTSSSFISEIELQMLINEGVVNKSLASQSQPAKVHGISWRIFFSSPVLAVCYAHAVFNFGRYFLYGWIPTFYSQVLGVPAATAAFCLTALQVADAFVKLAVAPFADRLVKSGRLSILGLRRLLSCSGFIGFGAALGLCSLTTSPVLVTAALVLGKSAASCHAAGFKTNYLDISRAHTGSISGVGNTVATLSSTAAPLIAGTVIQVSGWSSMFFICLAVNLSGAAVFGIFSSAENLDPVLKTP
ncbi:PHT4, partial [Symbiodinium necroappetens]